MVERNLAKVEVASSSLVSRSRFRQAPVRRGLLFQNKNQKHIKFNVTGLVAEWSCSGLQSRVRRFDSDPGLHFFRKTRHGGFFVVGAVRSRACSFQSGSAQAPYVYARVAKW